MVHGHSGRKIVKTREHPKKPQKKQKKAKKKKKPICYVGEKKRSHLTHGKNHFREYE